MCWRQRVLYDDGVGIVAIALRIVSHEVLDRRAHALALYSLDIADGNARSQKGIFTEVFKIPAVHGSAIDVHSRPEQKMNAFGPRVSADLDADLFRQRGIPGCRKADSAGHGCGWSVVAHSQRPVRHPEAGHAKPGNTPQVGIVDPAQQV